MNFFLRKTNILILFYFAAKFKYLGLFGVCLLVAAIITFGVGIPLMKHKKQEKGRIYVCLNFYRFSILVKQLSPKLHVSCRFTFTETATSIPPTTTTSKTSLYTTSATITTSTTTTITSTATTSTTTLGNQFLLSKTILLDKNRNILNVG